MRLIVVCAALAAALAPALLSAQETVPPPRSATPPPEMGMPPDTSDAPKVAGTDVPPPKRTKFVAPAYPPEAKARGLRGIVILELVIDERGAVTTADVVRSVPPFDAAAVAAARQWEYEPSRVNGRPVRVRLTVPITFALRMPEMTREDGVPEMRQGAAPSFPTGMEGPAMVIADVTLHADGTVIEAAMRSGESPWMEAALQAIRTWRFAPSRDASELSFVVEVNFVAPARTGQPPRVDLKLTSPRRREPAAASLPAPVPSPAATGGDVDPAAERSVLPATDPVAVPAPPPTPAPAAPAPAVSPRPQSAIPPPPAAPEMEVIPGGPVPVPGAAPVPANVPGFSAVRDVTLGIGVPDLAKGRRPVVPPVARMAGAKGEVDVEFAVDAGGTASVQKVTGPEILKDAARQAVASWAFRRTSAERVYLVARFAFDGDMAKATVRPAE